MTKAGPFVAIMRRASHCRYDTVVMNNRMLLQCYDLGIDSDVGLHYILPIPINDDYDDPIYDTTFIISPAGFLKKYGVWHKEMEAIRKEKKVRPRDSFEELCFKESGAIKILYYLNGEVIGAMSYSVEYPIDPTSRVIENIEHSYQTLIERIKPGGVCLMYDGLRLDLQQKAMNSSEIYFFIAKLSGKKIRVPIYRSLFSGIKEVDRFIISIQESTIGQDVYIYCVQYMKKGIAENMWGYILAF